MVHNTFTTTCMRSLLHSSFLGRHNKTLDVTRALSQTEVKYHRLS